MEKEDLKNNSNNTINNNNVTNINNNTGEKKKSKKNILLYIIILLLILIAFLGVKKDNKPSRLERDINALEGLLPGKTPEEIQKLLNEKVEEGMVNISINPDPVFENGKAEGIVAIENIPGNHYLLQVDIALDDTGEVVFSSGLIDPGFYIEKIKLDKNLTKGDYPATATFTAYYPDEIDQALAKVSAEIMLHILN